MTALCIKRKPDQLVTIKHAGETLVIRAEQYHGNQVALYFAGPKSFDIQRPDRFEKKPAETTRQ